MSARSGPVRRQFQSCDACRRRRKACDAGQLGLVSKDTPSGPDHGACTPCQKKGTRCTFNWLVKTEKRDATLPPAGAKTSNAKVFKLESSPHDAESSEITAASDFPPNVSKRNWLEETPSRHSDQTDVSPASVWPTSATKTTSARNRLNIPDHPIPRLRSIESSATSRDSFEDHDSLFSSRAGQLRRSPSSSSSLSMYEQGTLRASPTGPLTDRALSVKYETSSVGNVLLRIYQQNLEHAFSGWATAINSPYVWSRLSLPGMNGKVLRLADNNFYERAIRMDECISQLRLPNAPILSNSQHARASDALQKAILAYASQWNVSYNRNTSMSTPTDSLSASMHGIMQRTLWHQARVAVESIEHLSCFKSILAYLIFAAVPSPFLLDEVQDPTTAYKGPKREPIQHALDELAVWRRLLTQAKGQSGTNIAHQEDSWTALLNEFGIMYWLGVMCDTTTAALTEAPLAYSDEESSVNQEKVVAASSQIVLPPTPTDEPPMKSREQSTSLWTDTLVVRTQPYYGTSHSWPLTAAQIGALLQQAVPIKVLLNHRIAYLKMLVTQRASPKKIEDALQNALVTYQQWHIIFGEFMANCAREWKSLPVGLCSWHVVLAVHWHYGVLLLAEQISLVDDFALGDPSRSRIRASSFLTAEMSLTNARSIAHLAQRYAEQDEDSATENARTMTSEPWSKITLTALINAGAVLLTAISADPTPTLAHFAARRGVTSFELKTDAQSIVDALYEYAARCALAEPAAAALEHKLMTLSKIAILAPV